jgi:HEPN domain-containing protein
MTDIEEIRKQVAALYEPFADVGREVPLALRAREYMFLAGDYIAAASVIERDGPHHWLPMLQLTGQAVELALKACLAASDHAPPIGHDLVSLVRQAQARGFVLDSSMCAAIVHLQHFYFQDLATGTKYKARYPSTKVERLGGAVPRNSTFTKIVTVLLDQAKQRTGA